MATQLINIYDIKQTQFKYIIELYRAGPSPKVTTEPWYYCRDVC